MVRSVALKSCRVVFLENGPRMRFSSVQEVLALSGNASEKSEELMKEK